jgi:nitroreductase
MMTGERAAFGEDERTLASSARAAERLRFFLQWAVLAPSRHNTQPWLFEIAGDELRVYADRARMLPVADPDGRQLLMSCGAAIANLRLAAAHFGHATSVELLPTFRRDGLLGRVRLEERSASTPELEELFRAIPVRRTNRLPLDGREPPDGLVTALLREARSECVSLRPVEPHQRRIVADLIAEGDDAAWSSSRFRGELAAWVRPNRSARRDGLPGYALGMSDAASLVHPLLVRLQSPASVEAERDRRRALGTKALIVLSTRRDGNAEWVHAGIALQRILLRATAAGLYASYFAQPIESPALRRKLADAIGDPGAPQVMLRLGYGLEPRAVPRRPVDQVLRRIETAAPVAAALALRSAPPVARTAAQPAAVPALAELAAIPPPELAAMPPPEPAPRVELR